MRKSNKSVSTQPESSSVARKLYFSAVDLARYELAQSRLYAQFMAIRVKKLELENEKMKYDLQFRKLVDELTVFTAEGKRLEEQLREVQQRLSAEYDVDLSRITYDDVSGKITVLD